MSELYICDKCEKTHDGTGIYCEDCSYKAPDETGEQEVDYFDDK